MSRESDTLPAADDVWCKVPMQWLHKGGVTQNIQALIY